MQSDNNLELMRMEPSGLIAASLSDRMAISLILYHRSRLNCTHITWTSARKLSQSLAVLESRSKDIIPISDCGPGLVGVPSSLPSLLVLIAIINFRPKLNILLMSSRRNTMRGPERRKQYSIDIEC